MIWFFHFIIVNMLLFISKKRKSEDFFVKSTFFYSIFVFGQRWMTGEDFPGYLLYYLIDFPGKEIGYFGLQKLFLHYDLYFGLLIFFMYSITVFNNYKFIKNINKNIVFILYLYMFIELYFVQMSQIRQFIAVSFFINSYFFVFEKKYIKSFFNMICAISFHFSALLMFPILFIRLKLSRKTLFYFLIFCSILPLINIKPILNLEIFNAYSHYIGSIYDVNLSFFHYIRFFVVLIILLIYIYNLKGVFLKKTDEMIFNGLFFYLLFYGLSFQFAPMLRISNYFKIFELIFIGYYLKDIAHFSTRLVKGTILSMFFMLYLGMSLFDPYNITRYEFRRLRLEETRSVAELLYEIEEFYYD